MRIIFLNSWFGKVGKPFFDFLKSESTETDIFCFMEVSPELFAEISNRLKDYTGFIEKGAFLKEFGVIDCQAIFVRKKLKILSSGKINLYINTPVTTGYASYVTIGNSERVINLLNVHGKVLPGCKTDTPARIKQSNTIIEFMKGKRGLKIIGGDFNLNPDTKSVGMFEEAGYRDLIKDFEIKNTRNEISWKQFQSKPGFVKQYFADYVFVSKDVKVTKFEVPYMEISDHLPQILEFEG